ncbi:hypothetical protein E4P39_04800 [Blastococcus sp. CT_GayMR19]|uniref:hypothetical protein n=1 Tax=Blastococcus sp. CT_GayMR19 TaxID=2559608 RepID=UPI001073FDBC|nr:hypothetical protein [Blastococcus sp. CT_GayMR19]TFV78509.1 hypothetical protein E4P39_04800 [Blastococcus sp. CT_GayMR19]
MARELPEIVRAAAGLAATVLDEARKLPETLPGLPVRVIGVAMQQAMKVQQQYAGLVARGDELFTGLRGEDEPGLATFDDDIEPVVVTPPGFRDSPFDRAGETSASDAATYPVTDAEADELPDDPAADAVTAVVDDLADQVETGRQSIEELVDEAPAIAEILDEIAIDDLVDQAPSLDETAPTAEDTLDAEPTADVATTVDVLTAEGDVAAVEATVTDEGIAAPEAPDTDEGIAAPQAPATTADATGSATATDESGSPVAAATGVRTDVGETDTAEEDAAIAEGAAVDAVGETSSSAPTDDAAGGSELSGSQAAGTAPIDGYDSFSIAQLRGRLRGYALSTVQDLVAYEEATRGRQPYLKMLRNRLEKLEEQAVAASPLAPRGA